MPNADLRPLTRVSLDRYPGRMEGIELQQGVLAWVEWKRRSVECCEALRTRALDLPICVRCYATRGFDERVRGSHHIFSRTDVAEILNLQPRGGQAKPYQVKQVRGVILSYRLAGDAEEPTSEIADEDTADGTNNEGFDAG